MGHVGAANRHIIFGSCQEAIHEGADRVWRRWLGFCRHAGDASDPFLILLSVVERELFSKAFLHCYRTTNWSPSGDIAGVRAFPVVSGTVRQAAGHVASAFRSNLRESPLHVKGNTHLRPCVR